jgi:hypothetical protein
MHYSLMEKLRFIDSDLLYIVIDSDLLYIEAPFKAGEGNCDNSFSHESIVSHFELFISY